MIGDLNYLVNDILSQSLAVRPPILPEVNDLIRSSGISIDDSVKHYSTNIKKWLSPVIDLSDFYVYPMNGITEGINWWYHQECRGVLTESGEYQWVEQKESGMDAVVYQSIPNAANGMIRELSTKPVILDLAYLGSTSQLNLPNINNVEKAFFSLSKSFGLRNVRTGWYFTREEDTKLNELVNHAKYYNYVAHSIAELVISKYDVHYVYNRCKSEQARLCSILDMTPSDSVWLATSTDPKYKKFRRCENDENARICLAKYYDL